MKDVDRERLVTISNALSHPLRVRILEAFGADHTVSPIELAKALDAKLSSVSYHTRKLVEFGAIKLVDTKPVRGSVQHFYRPTGLVRYPPTVPRNTGPDTFERYAVVLREVDGVDAETEGAELGQAVEQIADILQLAGVRV